jgi:hypothetical protein
MVTYRYIAVIKIGTSSLKVAVIGMGGEMGSEADDSYRRRNVSAISSLVMVPTPRYQK